MTTYASCHRIRRVSIEVEAATGNAVSRIEQRVAGLFKEQVVPRLELELEALGLATHNLRIPRLEVDLGNIPEDRFEREFPEACLSAIRQALSRQIAGWNNPDTGQQEVTPSEMTLEIFLFFLRNGTFPWYAAGYALLTLESALLEALPDKLRQLRSVLSAFMRSAAIRQRFIEQFSLAFIQQILPAALEWVKAPTIQEAIHRLERRLDHPLTGKEQKRLWKAVLAQDQLVSPEKWTEIFSLVLLELRLKRRLSAAEREIWQQVMTSSDTEGSFEYWVATFLAVADSRPAGVSGKPRDGLVLSGATYHVARDTPWSPSEPTASISDENYYLIDYAGLVLLHPFLEMFFGGLNLLNGNHFIDRAAQERAVHLLYHLASGAENPEEHLLPLCKLLCGLDIHEVAERDLDMTEPEKSESLRLLESVVGHWTALKNTSPDGLRQGFLQRSGRLSKADFSPGWMLRIERQGWDVLLEKLPWGYSVIKLPWMKEMLYVDWS